MRRTDLSLYEKRLRKSVSGFRLRSKVQAAFRRSLSPLLEETPCPSYDALLRAFGPPEHMAQTLLQTMTTHRIPGAASQNGFLLSVSLCFLFSGASVRCPSEIVPNKISHCQTLPLIQRKSYSKTMFFVRIVHFVTAM